ncbi:MAG: hypothetical protein KBB21_01575, partial [Nannocystaceae bacterium]|nr:hypothetical protein [Nannocystaceae bacterium]
MSPQSGAGGSPPVESMPVAPAPVEPPVLASAPEVPADEASGPVLAVDEGPEGSDSLESAGSPPPGAWVAQATQRHVRTIGRRSITILLDTPGRRLSHVARRVRS